MKGFRPAPLILGHRGYRARFPENTLLAFREALRAGADGIECDLQKSADGRYVVIHDPGTERVTGAPREVARTTHDDLKKLDFGRGQRIPLLEELLESLPPEAYLDLELKAETLRPPDSDRIARILDAHRTRERLMISSFDPNLLIPFRRQGFTVGCLIGEESTRGGIFGLAKAVLRLRPQFLNLPAEILPMLGARRAACVFGALRFLGFSLLFWTVNSVRQAVFLAPHARIIVTDEVEQLIGKTTDY
ncbi:MAG: glycerophosphodiester phosphodiesterase family protein [Spirochaetia bacterium]|jgi:glycerophosphoryl diester phosphodiesterase